MGGRERQNGPGRDDLYGECLKFRPKNPNELQNLSDEEIIDYVVQARVAGDDGAVNDALAIFVYGRLHSLTAFISKRLRGNWQDAEDLAVTVLENVITSSFDGESVGQLVNFMKQIAVRRAFDFNQKAEKQRGDVPYDPSDPDDFTELPSTGDSTGAVDVGIVFDEVIGSLPVHHQDVVTLRIDGYSSKETAELVNNSGYELDPPMSGPNVDQIYKRFRDELRKQLGMGTGK